MSKNDYKNSEAMGQIKTMPQQALELEETQFEQSIADIDNPQDFAAAIGNAQMDHLEYIEVSEKLFNYLLKNSKSSYLTYGKPGVKVYKKGTREAISREENMSADQYGDYIGKKRNAEKNNG